MTPTMKLRFVKRQVSEPIEWGDGSYTIERTITIRVLQQWWRQDRPHGQMLGQEGQWVDVPLEKEE